MEPVRIGDDGPIKVSVWVPPGVILENGDPVLVSLPLPPPPPPPPPLLVDEGVGGFVMMMLVSVVPVPELEPGTGVGVGVCAGPSGVVKLSSPARKLEQTAWPALMASPSAVGSVQLLRMHPPILLAMTLCVGPHWHAMSLS